MGAAFHSHANRCRSCSGNLLLMAAFARIVVQPPEEFQARRGSSLIASPVNSEFLGIDDQEEACNFVVLVKRQTHHAFEIIAGKDQHP